MAPLHGHVQSTLDPLTPTRHRDPTAAAPGSPVTVPAIRLRGGLAGSLSGAGRLPEPGGDVGWRDEGFDRDRGDEGGSDRVGADPGIDG